MESWRQGTVGTTLALKGGGDDFAELFDRYRADRLIP
jgi:hypothetical protein